MNYDVIGDIHGHADRLEALLARMEYRKLKGAWQHPSRSAIFVGDLIDRGPGQLKTLELVRSMTEAGSAQITMGNHELNAIAWATPDPAHPGQHLRPRHGAKGFKNRHQHTAFLTEVGEDSLQHRAWIEWFMEFPLWIEMPDFRVVHACWSQPHADALKPHLRSGNRVTEQAIVASCDKRSALFPVMDLMIKGAEVRLPDGVSFTDKDGTIRHEIRTRWWKPGLTTYRSAYIGPKGVEIPDLAIVDYTSIEEPDRPTFIGHYWLDPDDAIGPQSRRVACVDYSVAKNGPLVAYRYDGEAVLSADKFVAV